MEIKHRIKFSILPIFFLIFISTTYKLDFHLMAGANSHANNIIMMTPLVAGILVDLLGSSMAIVLSLVGIALALSAFNFFPDIASQVAGRTLGFSLAIGVIANIKSLIDCYSARSAAIVIAVFLLIIMSLTAILNISIAGVMLGDSMLKAGHTGWIPYASTIFAWILFLFYVYYFYRHQVPAETTSQANITMLSRTFINPNVWLLWLLLTPAATIINVYPLYSGNILESSYNDIIMLFDDLPKNAWIYFLPALSALSALAYSLYGLVKRPNFTRAICINYLIIAGILALSFTHIQQMPIILTVLVTIIALLISVHILVYRVVMNYIPRQTIGTFISIGLFLAFFTHTLVYQTRVEIQQAGPANDVFEPLVMMFIVMFMAFAAVTLVLKKKDLYKHDQYDGLSLKQEIIEYYRGEKPLSHAFYFLHIVMSFMLAWLLTAVLSVIFLDVTKLAGLVLAAVLLYKLYTGFCVWQCGKHYKGWPIWPFLAVILVCADVIWQGWRTVEWFM